MSQWAGIESAPAAVPVIRRDPARPVPPPARLKRTERLIVGSIDGAAHVLQRKARDVLVGSALFLVPLVGLNLLLALLAYREFDTFDGLLGDRGYVGVEAGFAFVAFALQSFSAHLIGAYTAAYLVRYQMGGDPTLAVCAVAVLRRLPTLLLTWLLTHWWALLLGWGVLTAERSTAALLVFLVPPIAAVVSGGVLLVTPVMMGERLGLKAIPRAWRLVRGRLGTAIGFVLACAVLSVMLFSFIAFLPTLAKSTGLVTFGSYTWLVQGVTSQLALLVVVPFTGIATAQLYLQMRVHTEGMDIVMAADRAFGTLS